MTDEEIVELYWQRSEKAITCTMQRYGAYLMKIALNILHVREEAEECVNESYFSAWNQMPSDRPGKLLPYLGRITRCLCLNRYDYLSAEKRNGSFKVLLSELEDCLTPGDVTQQQYEAKEIADAISRFLRTQDEESRNMFLRRYWYSDSIEQIAGRFGVRQSKVKSQLFRVRRRLKAYLEKEGYIL